MPKQVYSAGKLLEWLHEHGNHSMAELIFREGESGTFDPTPPVQPDTEISQEDAREMADMIAKMNAKMKSTNDNLSQMINRLEVIK